MPSSRLLMLEPVMQNALFDAVAELYAHLVSPSPKNCSVAAEQSQAVRSGPSFGKLRWGTRAPR